MTGVLGLNCDPLRGDCSPGVIAATGARWVRLVLRQDGDLRPWLADCRQHGINALGVLARESVVPFDSWNAAATWYAQRYGPLLSAVQPGNEPDQSGPASWTMTPGEFGAALNMGLTFKRLVSGLPVVAGGLASGNAQWPNGVTTWGWVDAIAIHYPAGAAKVQEYARLGRPIWITEGWPDPAIIRACIAQSDVPVYVAWWHDPVGDGALPLLGHLDRIAAFQQIAKEMTPMPIPAVPTPVADADIWRARWTIYRPNAVYRHDFGIPTAWRANVESWGIPLWDDEQAMNDGGTVRQGMLFHRIGRVVWRPSGAAVLGWP